MSLTLKHLRYFWSVASHGSITKAAETLLKHGFADVSNLEGGIIAWSEEIDNSLPVY